MSEAQIDLFRTPLEVREEVRRSSGKGYRTSPNPKEEVRKFGSPKKFARSSNFFGAVPEATELPNSNFRVAKSSADQKRTGKPKRSIEKETDFGLLKERRKLWQLIERAETEYAQANAAQQPFKQAFDDATLEVQRLHRLRRGGATVQKTTMLDAYDWRVVTGHEWHPHRSKAEDLARYLKSLREELKAVNREIGV